MPGLAGDTDGDAKRRFMLLQKKTFAEKKQPLKHTLYVAVFENNGWRRALKVFGSILKDAKASASSGKYHQHVRLRSKVANELV